VYHTRETADVISVWNLTVLGIIDDEAYHDSRDSRKSSLGKTDRRVNY